MMKAKTPVRRPAPAAPSTHPPAAPLVRAAIVLARVASAAVGLVASLLPSIAAAQSTPSAGQPGTSGGTSAPSGGATGSGASGTGTSTSTGSTSSSTGSDSGAANGSGAAPPAATTTTIVPPYGFPRPGTKLESYLPSSSHASSDATSFQDHFDLGPKDSGGDTVFGNPNATAILDGRSVSVPPMHVVRRGDTLWDLCDHYFANPWTWPRVWALNAQVQNPHWIYPGDHLRLRGEGSASVRGEPGGGSLVRRPSPGGTTNGTIFLRDQGFLDDPKGTWGEISGSPDDQMLLSAGNVVYITLRDDHMPRPGQDLTLFHSVRKAPAGAKGEVVQIVGTARVDSVDTEKRLARATLTESLDVIERGAKAAPLTRRFNIVPPLRSNIDVRAAVLASVHPLVFHGQNQVVFIDKGKNDGLQPGNRLFVLRRGDPWRATLKGTGDLSDKSVRSTAEQTVETESVRGTDRDNDYPDEVVGELRVLSVRENTAATLVTSAQNEIVQGDVAVTRKGY